MRPRLPAWLAAVALVLAGCTASGSAESPRDGRAGVQMSGRLDTTGSVAVSHGRPQLLEGDCEAETGVPAEVCVATRDIGGTVYVLGFGNLDRLPRGERIDVATRPCASAEACAAVDDGAVVLLQAAGELHRPTGGTALIRHAERDERYAGRLRLDVDGGSLSVELDVVPAPPDPRRPEGQGQPELETFTPDEVEPYDPQANG